VAKAKDTQFWCQGRLRFELPKSINLVHRDQSIFNIQIKTIPIPVDSNSTLVWDKRLSEIRGMSLPDDVVDLNVRTLTIKDDNAVFYQTTKRRVTLEVQKPYKDHVLSVVLEDSIGFESDMVHSLELIIQDYQPFISESVQDARGFCLGNGELVTIASRNELTRTVFDLRTFKLELSIDTQTVGGRKDTSPMEALAMLKDEAPDGIDLTVKTRKVAGLRGKEGKLLMNGDSTLMYLWYFPGEGYSNHKPQIEIRLIAPETAREEADVIWKTLLSSLITYPVPEEIRILNE